MLFLGHSAKCCRVPGRTRQKSVNGTVLRATGWANGMERGGRTACDEPMAPQDVADKSNVLSNIAAGNYLKSSNIIFSGVNCHKKREEKKERKYIFIGAMQVYVDDELPI